MHTYTLTIKKDDFWIEFASKDKKIIEKELAIWINLAEKLLESTQKKEYKAEKFVPEKIELGKIILDAPKISPSKPKEDFPTVKEKPSFSYKISKETKEILQRAIHKPLPSMNEMLKPEPVKIIPKPEVVTPKVAEPLPIQPEPVIYNDPQDFTTIYNQKIIQENKSADKFAQLLSLSNIHNKFDCLIACAYHLVERENFERFTLKQINTLSKALLEESIEHDTLKEALEKRFIKIVPDYTGIATTMEYTLTEKGEEYFKDVILED